MSDSEGIEPPIQEEGGEEVKVEKKVPKGAFIDRDVDLSRSPVAVLEAERDAAQAESRENHDKYLRALAELENYKKRVIRERSEFLKYEGARIFLDILDVYDDLDRALQYSQGDLSQVKTGLEMIHKRFAETLSKWEVKGESAIGKKFDPNLFNAISRVPSSGHDPGTIIGELKKAFYYKDKILRHGEVVVAEGDPTASSYNSPEEEPNN